MQLEQGPHETAPWRQLLMLLQLLQLTGQLTTVAIERCVWLLQLLELEREWALASASGCACPLCPLCHFVHSQWRTPGAGVVADLERVVAATPMRLQ